MAEHNSTEQLIVIVSVDWEPDHGAWRCGGIEMDYGGILKGTPAFSGLLDELGIPSTWFIETSYDPKRDLPRRFPELVGQLAERKRDEIGLHIHWRKPKGDNSTLYDTNDIDWINAQIDHGVRQLDAFGARPRAFRSGALLHVRELPRMLSEKGFLVDSSTLWGKANRLKPDKKQFKKKPLFARARTLLHRVVAPIPRPYFTDSHDVELVGNSAIAEFPITYSLFDASRPTRGPLYRFLKYKVLLAGETRYLMLFFHIDELTSCATGPDEQTAPDAGMLKHFRHHLKALQRCGAHFVTCSAARSHWLRKAGSEARERYAC